MNTLKYYLRDAREGIQRNAGAAVATILLIFISLSITGALFLLKTGVDDVIGYLNSQVKIKVFVEPSVDTQEVADVLEAKSFVQSIEIETKEDTLNRLKQFFEGKEYLFVAFQDSGLPDAIVLELKNKEEEKVDGKILFEMAGFEPGPTGLVARLTFCSWHSCMHTSGIQYSPLGF